MSALGFCCLCFTLLALLCAIFLLFAVMSNKNIGDLKSPYFDDDYNL